MEKIKNIQITDNVGKNVTLRGWVNDCKNLGQITFIYLRDRSGLAQIVFAPSELDDESKEAVKTLRPEFVIEVKGTVNSRPKNQINKNFPTGTVEVLAKKLIILNRAKTPPFEINSEKKQISEKLRLKYRYLDLRREKIKNNLILRHKIIKFIRDYLDKEEFLEIETPILTKGTPEGAREFIVPSRLYPGKFYVLPQAPQQFKQLLMVAGLEKYFQIARCFRDEDTRGDRQPEFTQLDMEMSFIEKEDIMELIEKLIISLVKTVVPNKKITTYPFPRLNYDEIIKKDKTDKPDLRKNQKDENELAFCFITNFPLFEYSKNEKKIVSVHHPFTSPQLEYLPLLKKEPLKVKSQQYDLVCNGFEIGGGSIRIHQKNIQKQIFEILKIKKEEIKRRFGHLLEAFEYGAPPHGGIALGLDRLMMILANEPNIREVIPFAKTADAKDLMMGAPSNLPKEQIEQVNIEIKKKK
ncbi:MAG: aspartate--tRNA ligase [Patescibacteria group bacterium]|nr:aspartate--tRNA ligase [Patescibacteria group bacterium]